MEVVIIRLTKIWMKKSKWKKIRIRSCKSKRGGEKIKEVLMMKKIRRQIKYSLLKFNWEIID